MREILRTKSDEFLMSIIELFKECEKLDTRFCDKDIDTLWFCISDVLEERVYEDKTIKNLRNACDK